MTRHKFRIAGLVAAMNHTRAQWQQGLTPDEAPALCAFISDTLAQAEAMCRSHGRTPRQLPAQSYRAYLYLKSLDLNAIPLRAEAAPPPARAVRIRNLVSSIAGIQTDLLRLARSGQAFDTAQPEVAKLLAGVQSHTAHIEDICRRSNNTPAALPTPSRRAYQWLKYLGEPVRLLQLLATLAEARQVIDGMRWLREVELAPERVSLELLPSDYIYRTRVEGELAFILVAPGFAGAPRDVLEALVRAALSRRQRKARALIKAYTHEEPFAEASLAYEFAAGLPQLDVRGRCYDLAAVFAQVNAEYFAGRLSSPRLTWSKTVTSHTLGHYHAESDTVMLSILLDHAAIPPFAIAYVMYHELLHRELGVPLVNGRRRPHSPDFRAAERQFKQFAEAEAELKKLAMGLR